MATLLLPLRCSLTARLANLAGTTLSQEHFAIEKRHHHQWLCSSATLLPLPRTCCLANSQARPTSTQAIIKISSGIWNPNTTAHMRFLASIHILSTSRLHSQSRIRTSFHITLGPCFCPLRSATPLNSTLVEQSLM